MSPPFIFRIDEITEDENVDSDQDLQGRWCAPTRPGENVRVGGGASGVYWYNDGRQITKLTGYQTIPTGSEHFSTYSMYYADGHGFWIMQGDAASLSGNQRGHWTIPKFSYESNDYSSFLSKSGEGLTLRVQRDDQVWPRVLLPDIYHTATRTTGQYGGLTGDLPIFLALIAHSTKREWVEHALPLSFVEGRWTDHRYGAPRVNRRGVVCSVYTCPSTWAGGSTADSLRQYEEGASEKFFD